MTVLRVRPCYVRVHRVQTGRRYRRRWRWRVTIVRSGQPDRTYRTVGSWVQAMTEADSLVRRAW